MGEVKVKTEKVGGGFWTLPAFKSTASENGEKIAEAYSKPFGPASEARERLQDKLAERNLNRSK